jgi:Trk-type K+ transport systems, membrane components
MPVSALITLCTGFILRFATRSCVIKALNSREGVLTVVSSWLVVSLFGGLPYLLSNVVPGITEAFFESISGFTTTGATVLVDIEEVPKDILFWRSLTQWLGGLGILLFAIAILPSLGAAGLQPSVTEMNGLSYDKLHPRVFMVVKRLWGFYFIATLAAFVLLAVGEMSAYDALNHALTTLSSGGFSTKNTSVAGYGPYTQSVLIFFMILSGCNFSLLYLAIVRQSTLLFKNEEFQGYLLAIFVVGLLVSVGLFFMAHFSAGTALMDSFFAVVSALSTTGLFVADYMTWPVALWLLLLLLMFIGACSGSTSGGFKMIRHQVLFKNSFLEMKRILHPNALIPVKINGKSLSSSIVFKAMALVFVYMIVFAIGMVILRLLGLDYQTSIGASVACLSNVGTGFGAVGPGGTYAFIPQVAKWILILLMIFGRLEIFTIIVLFSRNFWKS